MLFNSNLFAFFVYSCNAGRPSNSVATAIGSKKTNIYLSIYLSLHLLFGKLRDKMEYLSL